MPKLHSQLLIASGIILNLSIYLVNWDRHRAQCTLLNDVAYIYIYIYIGMHVYISAKPKALPCEGA